MNKIASRLGLSVIGTAGMCILSLAPVTAATIFVEPIITQRNPNYLDVALPPEVAPNTPFSWFVPDSSGEQNFFNYTGFDMTSFRLVLLTQQYNGDNVLWGDANGDGKIGQSDIFSSFTINPNNPRPQLDISGGLIPYGDSLYFNLLVILI